MLAMVTVRVRMPQSVPDTAPLIGFAGGGMYVSWIMGVADGMCSLGVPLDRCAFSGASAGAVVAALLACGVHMSVAHDWFLNDPTTMACFSSVTGAVARVRAVVTNLLTDTLPHDCVERCNGRLHVLMCSRARGLYFISQFTSKSDLIEAVIASTHVPYFSDGSYAFSYRGEQHVDGAWLSSRSAALLARPHASIRVLIDHEDDDSFESKRPFYEVAHKEAHLARFAVGIRYAARLRAEGRLPRGEGALLPNPHPRSHMKPRIQSIRD